MYHSHLSDQSGQDYSTSDTHLCTILQSLLIKGLWIHYLQPCGITRIVAKISIVVHLPFIYYYGLLTNFLLFLTEQLDHLDTASILLML